MAKKDLMLTALMAVLAAALFAAACNDASSPTAPPPPTEDSTAAPGSAGLVAGEPGDMPEPDFDPGITGQEVPVEMAAKGGVCSGKKVAICHVPPGNPTNIQEICISTDAEPAHLAHGDFAPLTFWPDWDGDGYGDASAPSESGCTVPPGYVENNADCDDDDAAINPDAEEVCDDVDNDCNGEVDEGGVCAACPCWDEPDLLSCTVGNGFCAGGGSYFVVIQNFPGSTPGVEGGFAAVFDPPGCLTRDLPPFFLPITAAEAEACADQIRSRCAAIGQPLPLSAAAATEGGARGGFPGWE